MPASRFQKYIDDCEQKYPGKYDYSLVSDDYKGCNSMVRIICKEHKLTFKQSMYILLKFGRNNCSKCKKGSKKQELLNMRTRFIDKAKALFPDLKLNFKKVKYINSSTPITLICEKHGEWSIKPNEFFNSKYGCSACGIENPHFRKIKGVLVPNGTTLAQFIEKARAVHGDKYDYSRVVYRGKDKNVKIKCPDHGIFPQTPDAHTNGKQGCKKCAREYNIKQTTWTKEQFLQRVYEIHGDRYDYSKVEYKAYDKDVIIICHIHGDFEQKPNNHIDNEQGCPKCGHISRCLSLSDTVDDFIRKARLTHGDRYDYSKVVYMGSRENIEIICKKHGAFPQIPASHIFGCGCPTCNQSKGEEMIESYLKRINVKFIQQKKFKGCKNKNYLKFDFYIPEWNCCIEYDGQQHFMPVEHFGGYKSFIQTQKNDKIKDNFCVDNDILLIRIPFTAVNAENYIDTIYSKLKKAKKIYTGKFYETYKILLKLEYQLLRLELIVKLMTSYV